MSRWGWLLPLSAVFAASPAGAGPPLVPWPREVRVGAGVMRLDEGSRIVTPDDRLVPLAQVLAEEVFLTRGLLLAAVRDAARPGDISLEADGKLPDEAYTLTVAETAAVRGGGYAGVAQGSVTLLQALRAAGGGGVELPRLTVRDRPHFAYRGAMLDVARKPYSVETLKQCVRVCRFYKVRHLHLHLSDENAWTFPSRAFPQLGTKNFAWAGGDRPAVYRPDELTELVAFADARGVTLVPELEVPGHSGQLRGTLPEVFGYRDDAGKTVTPGVVNMVREETYAALDTLVGEVSAVFRSSPYFHIGCDEASVAEVEKLPEVRAFMRKHGLASVHGVFNHFVHRMHGIVRKHGKRLIVWEGPPLDPVPPPRDVIFMPWVGGAGTAAELVKRGYAVINPPWGTQKPYMDPYLVNGARLRRGEPLLLGATSILWEKPQEEAVPFLRQAGALRNEPTHNPDSGRDYEDFLQRLRLTEPALDRLLAGLTFAADGVLDPRAYLRTDAIFRRGVTATLATALDPGRVRYTLDGSEPSALSPRYAGPVRVRRTATLKARYFGAGGTGATFSRTFLRAPALTHDAVGAAVVLSPDQPGYYGPGPKGLADGLLAVGDEAGSAGWVGWEGHGAQVRVTLDLGKPTAIRKVGAHFLRAAGGIFLPRGVDFETSDDGREFRQLAAVPDTAGVGQRGWYAAAVGPVTARYLRVRPTPGGDWTFLDEVAVNQEDVPPGFRHAARGKPVTLAAGPDPAYAAPGVAGLTDGHRARSADFMNPVWLGFEGKDLHATIDLGRPADVRAVGASFLQYVQAGIRIPGSVDVLVSDDGKQFRPAATIRHRPDERSAHLQTLTAELKGVRARHVRLVAHTNGQWLFADEVFVNPEPDEDPGQEGGQ